MAGLIDLFIPKEKKFFDDLSAQISILKQSALTLLKLSKQKTLHEQLLKSTLSLTKKYERASESINNKITVSLHQTFITPIDREDIKILSLDIHRIVSAAYKITASLYYFQIKTPHQCFKDQLKVLGKQVSALVVIFGKILSHKINQPLINRIKQWEIEGDDVFRKGMGRLLNQKKTSAIDVIKYKELYEITEEAIDDIKHMADILEMILVNNS